MLRELLKIAPHDPRKGSTSNAAGADATHLGYYKSRNEEVYFWTDVYCDLVYDALIKILEDYGLEGWEVARWTVYLKASVFVLFLLRGS